MASSSPRLLLLALVGCGGRTERPHASAHDGGGAGFDAGEDREAGPLPIDDLRLERVQPAHGPTTGGNTVDLVGTGFSRPGAPRVFFGAVELDPSAIHVGLLWNLRVEVPPGEVGPVDVRLEKGGQSAILPDGYTYDPFRVEPGSGPTTGGTRVDVLGSGVVWDVDAVVTFDGAPANCDVVSGDHLQCWTPPGELGKADVRVVDGLYDATVEDAFRYEFGDPRTGGFTGGPIDGRIVVTVLDTYTLRPVSDAFVMLGLEGGPYQGWTDAEGGFTFEGDDLVGPQTLTVAKDRYERATFVDFDASLVTVLIPPFSPEPPHPPLPHGYPSVEGTLIDPWALVPEPIGEDEKRVCWVSATASDIFRDAPPAVRVAEGDGASPYGLLAGSGSVAIWAVCGLESGDPPALDAYAMGVQRDVVIGAGERIDGVDFPIDLPLDHLVLGRLNAPPVGLAGQRVEYQDEIFIDLGDDGVIARTDRMVSSFDPAADFRFAGQPPLDGPLADASFLFVGSAFGGGGLESFPQSKVVRRDVVDVSLPVDVEGFIGFPTIVAPLADGAVIDRTFSWLPSGAERSFQALELRRWWWYAEWRVFLPPDADTCTLPDLTAIAGLDDLSSELVVRVTDMRVPGASWSEFRYDDYFARNGWEAWAEDGLASSGSL